MPSTNWSGTLEAKKDYALGFASYPIFSGTTHDFIAHFVRKEDTLLDFGCGPQKQLSKIPCAHYYSLDLDTSVGADFSSLKSASRKRFDVVASNVVMEHLSVDEIRETFRIFSTMTKRIIFVVPNAWANYGVYASDYTHKTNLAIRGWGGLLREAGIMNRALFYRISPSRFKTQKEWISRITGVDFCESIGCVVDVSPDGKV